MSLLTLVTPLLVFVELLLSFCPRTLADVLAGGR